VKQPEKNNGAKDITLALNSWLALIPVTVLENKAETVCCFGILSSLPLFMKAEECMLCDCIAHS